MPRNSRSKLVRSRWRGGAAGDLEVPELDLTRVRVGILRTEWRAGVEYSVQTSVGGRAEDAKVWICPHCSLQIQKGTAHLVAWDSIRGLETRRHFHSNCWRVFRGQLL